MFLFKSHERATFAPPDHTPLVYRLSRNSSFCYVV